MAEIRVLPIVPSCEGANHIIGLLTAAASEKRDLGSRVPHIRLHARALDVLVQDLGTSLEAFHSFPEAIGLEFPAYQAALVKLDRLVYDLRKLVELSDALPTEVD